MHVWTMILITFNPTEHQSTLAPPSPLKSTKAWCGRHQVSIQAPMSSAGSASDIVSVPPPACTKTKSHHAFFNATVNRRVSFDSTWLTPLTVYPLHLLLRARPLLHHFHDSFCQKRRTLHRAGQIILLFLQYELLSIVSNIFHIKLHIHCFPLKNGHLAVAPHCSKRNTLETVCQLLLA